MKKSVAFVSLSALIFIAGCTSNPTSHTQNTTFSPKSENVVKEKKSIYIGKGFYMSNPTKNLFREPTDVGLVEGRYIAELKDQYGIYYRGPRQCIFIDNKENAKHSLRREGGLYIPNHGVNQEVVIYYYMNSESKPDGNSIPSGLEQNGPYLQGQAERTGTVSGAAGTALGGAIANGIISSLNGKIGFMPRSDIKPLMRLVTQE